MGVVEFWRLRQLEDENRKMKKIVTDLMLDKHILQDVLLKKTLRPVGKRRLVGYVKFAYKTSMRWVCELAHINREMAYYQSCKWDRGELRVRMRDLAMVGVRYGYRRLHVLLRRERWRVNHKLVYRI